MTGPDVPASSSPTPQCRKLGITPGHRVALDHPPAEWALSDPPPDVVIVGDGKPADVVVAFFRVAAELPERLAALARRIHPTGALWVAWPRRAGGHTSDITDTVVREHALELGIVDVKVAAIDDDWSGLRFVWRVANRPAGR